MAYSFTQKENEHYVPIRYKGDLIPKRVERVEPPISYKVPQTLVKPGEKLEAYPTEYGNVARVGTKSYDIETGRQATKSSLYRDVKRPIWRFAQQSPIGFRPEGMKGLHYKPFTTHLWKRFHTDFGHWRYRGQGNIKDWRQPDRQSWFDPTLRQYGFTDNKRYLGSLSKKDEATKGLSLSAIQALRDRMVTDQDKISGEFNRISRQKRRRQELLAAEDDD